MRIAVLIDGKVALWQREALLRTCSDHEIYVLQSSGWASRRRLRHACYYALNLFTVRNRLTRKVDFPAADLEIVETIAFEPQFEGAWASLPEPLLDRLGELKIDAIVKFGLGLLRVPPRERLPAPILSFHHGDPRKYRGRPAGFYELANGERYMGQIVQAIGSRLDAGTVYAFAESRVVAHSYRQTLINAFSLSPYLLREALNNVQRARPIDIVPEGPNYRLPSNLAVLRFVAARFAAALRHAFYGAFVEKRWRVALAKVADTSDPCRAVASAEKAPWKSPPIAAPFRFYADPFFGEHEGDIFVEAMNSRTGKGELVRITNDKHERISGLAGHVSYPASLMYDGRFLLVPETADWCGPTGFRIDGARAVREIALDVDSNGIWDPTLLRHNGRIYLFGNLPEEGSSVLHLWHSERLDSRFERHPASPIRVSARGSRMAGEITQWDGQLYRLGQDYRRSYGDGILAFRIVALDAEQYVEEWANDAHFESVSGPHTVNRRGDLLLFDYYQVRFTPLAGVRRILSRP